MPAWRFILAAVALITALPVGIQAGTPGWNGADTLALICVATFLFAAWPLIHLEHPMTIDQARERLSAANARVIRAEQSNPADLPAARAEQERAAEALARVEAAAL